MKKDYFVRRDGGSIGVVCRLCLHQWDGVPNQIWDGLWGSTGLTAAEAVELAVNLADEQVHGQLTRSGSCEHGLKALRRK